MLLDTSLLNTQQYKVHIKGKGEQSKESSCVVATEKGAFGLPSTTVANSVECITIVMCRQISYKSFKDKITYGIFTYEPYP